MPTKASPIVGHEIDVLRDVAAEGLPPDLDFWRWAGVALEASTAPLSVAIRLVDEDEGRRLNRAFRGHDAATNVLSFNADLPAEVLEAMDRRPLGDVVLCAPRVAAEALEQGKPAAHHWAHLTIHGVLHLLGHDHERPEEAERMETLERELLQGLGIPDPYGPAETGAEK